LNKGLERTIQEKVGAKTMALENARQIIACANRLATFASSARSRLLELIEKGEISDKAISKVQGSINFIHQKSDELVMDAIEFIISDLEVTQTELEVVLKDAKNAVKQIQDVARFIDLMADVVVLSAAVISRKPNAILASLAEIRDDLLQLEENSNE
jgi:hypothetical protein